MYKGCCLFFIGTVKNNPPSEKHIGIVVYGKLYGKERFGRFGTENKKYFRRWVIFKIRNARCAGVGGGEAIGLVFVVTWLGVFVWMSLCF